LVGRLGVRELVVGYNHRFGRDRQGDASTLDELGRKYGFRVHRAARFAGDGPDGEGGEKISSTAIREALARGDVRAAERMLGRQVEATGGTK
jgi:riboflavin kinase/FMN adenylyltransferase